MIIRAVFIGEKSRNCAILSYLLKEMGHQHSLSVHLMQPIHLFDLESVCDNLRLQTVVFIDLIMSNVKNNFV